MREGDIYEVDTPNVAFTVKEAGAFRIDVSENGDGTRITAIRGSGDVTAAGQTYTVHPGERAEFVGTDAATSNTSRTAHEPPDSPSIAGPTIATCAKIIPRAPST